MLHFYYKIYWNEKIGLVKVTFFFTFHENGLSDKKFILWKYLIRNILFVLVSLMEIKDEILKIIKERTTRHQHI